MSENLPDFTKYGYQLRTELGQNRLGGRTTYLATNSQNYPVVIKQFQFATSGSSWGEYDAYQQEITMLRRLQHPGIPRYLDAFQTPDGFCMVQQYISGESLATPRNWTPQEIKHIALATLEILTYLQSQHPPIIHRDIKPENLLVDEQMKVYLVDFGFARMGGGEIAASSVVKGTMGFMPPEQLFNRQLTTASDLYGLGATLICLLTGTKSGDIGNLIDADYQIHFQHLFPPLKRGWMSWLAKITAPKVTDRYPSAAAALAALKPLDVDRLPKLIISHNSLQFTATKWQEKVSQTVTLSNPIPETLLAGQFSVVPHPSDPPHTPYDHAWISFDRTTFEGNLVNCEITVDTSKLLADTSYTREVWVQSNADVEPQVIRVNVQTAPLPKPLNFVGWLRLVVVLIISGFVGWGLAGNSWLLLVPGLIAVVATADRMAGAGFLGIEANAFKALVMSLIGQILLGIFLLVLNFFSQTYVIISLFIALLGARIGWGLELAEIKIKKFFIGFFVWLISCIIFGNVATIIGTIGLVLLPAMWVGKVYRHFKGDLQTYYETKAQRQSVSFVLVTALLGIGLGAEVVTISEFLGKLATYDFPLWSDWRIISAALVTLLGFIPILCPGIMLAYSLSNQLKLKAYVRKYALNKLPLIKP
uniref:Serine/threonine protein kinase n=1 Tax=Planktothricoides sp. SpSt-374 TaxID=2282167 RepID=A0A7C3VGC7_9CYAN